VPKPVTPKAVEEALVIKVCKRLALPPVIASPWERLRLVPEIPPEKVVVPSPVTPRAVVEAF